MTPALGVQSSHSSTYDVEAPQPFQQSLAASLERTGHVHRRLPCEVCTRRRRVGAASQETRGHTPGSAGENNGDHPTALAAAQQASQQVSPRNACMPSRTMIGTITSAATGSAHHQPNSVCSVSPTSRTPDRYAHSEV